MLLCTGTMMIFRVLVILSLTVLLSTTASAGYVANDPINNTDPTGLEIVCNNDTCSDSISGYETKIDDMTTADYARFNSFVEPSDLESVFNNGYSGGNVIPNASGGDGFASGNPGAGGQRYLYTDQGWVDLKHVGAAMANGPLGNELGSFQEMTQGPSSAGFAEDYLSNAIGERSWAEQRGNELSPGEAVSNVMRNNFGLTPMTGEQFLRNAAPSIAGQPQPLGSPIQLKVWDSTLMQKEYCTKC